jgi:trimethylguanosine synthase
MPSVLVILICLAGPGYRSDEVFNLRTMEPYSLSFLYKEFSTFSEHIVLYLPRTSDLRQLAKIVEDGKKADVVHYCMDGASKALCIYYGGVNVKSSSRDS